MKRKSLGWVIICVLGFTACGPLGPDVTTSTTSDDFPLLKSVTPLSPTSLRLEWEDRSQGEDGFIIRRREVMHANQSGGQPDTKITEFAVGADVTSHDDSGLTPSTTFYYKIYYIRGDETSKASNEISQTTPAL